MTTEAQTETPETTAARPNETSVLSEGAPAETQAAPEEAAPETKPAEEVKAEPPALDTKAFKLPEGFTADDTKISEFTTVLSNDKLSPQERAQELLNLHARELKAAAEGPSKEWDSLTTKWVGEIANDKDLGTGDAKSPLKPEVKAALSKIIDQVGGTELRQALDFTGAGNNPHVVRAFYKLGQRFLEGTPVQGNPATGAAAKSAAATLYPENPA